jgi:hypothetical protein
MTKIVNGNVPGNSHGAGGFPALGLIILLAVFTACSTPTGGDPAASGPTVTGVTVSPSTVTVARGGSQSFSAVVAGTGNPAQTVTWSVEGASDSRTTISADGVLTVAAGETAASLTVRATSAVDAAKSGTASVTVAVAGEQDIPSFTYSNSAFGYPVFDIDYSVNGTNIAPGGLHDTTPPKGNTPADIIRQDNVYDEYFYWLYDMQMQSKNLKTGYTAVAGVYSQFNPLKTGESSIINAIGGTSNVGTYITNAKGHFDTILDGILGDTGETRADFDKYYNAYTTGKYYEQKAINKAGSLQAYTTALTAIGNPILTAQGTGALQAIYNEMVSAINTKLGTGDMTNTGNKEKAEELNRHFITQIADLYELQAVMDDLNSLNFNNDLNNDNNVTFEEIREFKSLDAITQNSAWKRKGVSHLFYG